MLCLQNLALNIKLSKADRPNRDEFDMTVLNTIGENESYPNRFLQYLNVEYFKYLYNKL